MYSRSNEDAIIDAIFARIGTTNKRFVEFGCGYGTQNNTLNLICQGWSGLWIETHSKRYQLACTLMTGHASLEILQRLVLPTNVNEFVTDPLDFLSIDIDGNDYAVWKAVTARPRVVCIEYDAKRGTSLENMIDLAVSKGYRLEACCDEGVNAIFVRTSEAKDEKDESRVASAAGVSHRALGLPGS